MMIQFLIKIRINEFKQYLFCYTHDGDQIVEVYIFDGWPVDVGVECSDPERNIAR